MRLLLTLGPGYEPIDGARRLTNMSTGRLGVTLANAFTQAGWEVHCFRGEGTSFQGPLYAHRVESFGTNDDLATKLRRWSEGAVADAVFHAAALCDFRVVRAANAEGEAVRSAKIATRDGRIRLELEPATKVLPLLRGWFPRAWLAGWKYELEGTREQAFARAWRQVRECSTDACVLNGAAYGGGFGLCLPGREVVELESAQELAVTLLGLLRGEAACAPVSVPAVTGGETPRWATPCEMSALFDR